MNNKCKVPKSEAGLSFGRRMKRQREQEGEEMSEEMTGQIMEGLSDPGKELGFF